MVNKLRSQKGGSIYITWQRMKQRCDTHQENAKHYKDRGISYDPTWTSFDAFILDMLDTWTTGTHLHRINSDLGYYKDNCVWLPRSEHIALHNRLRKEKRTQCKHGHEYTEENTRIDKYGFRICRACDRINHRKKDIKWANYSE